MHLGLTLGGYRLKKRLSVNDHLIATYLAQSKDRQAVVKILTYEKKASASRFSHEFYNLNNLNGVTGVPQLLSEQKHLYGQPPFMVQKFIEGEPLTLDPRLVNPAPVDPEVPSSLSWMCLFRVFGS